MHVSDGNRSVEELAGTSVTKSYFTVAADRNTLPKFSVISVFIQILEHFRKKLIFVLCFKFFPGSVNVVVCQIQGIHDIFLSCSVEYRRCNVETKCLGS